MGPQSDFEKISCLHQEPNPSSSVARKQKEEKINNEKTEQVEQKADSRPSGLAQR
jgi:hypothetical protein